MLRDIRRPDNTAVAKLIRSVMTEFGCVGVGYSINDPEVDDIFGAYQSEGSAFWVVEIDGQIQGCGGIGPLVGADQRICELQKMYFLPELRGQGWGHRMMHKCLEWASRSGYEQCYIETVNRMTAANALYLKYGFNKLSGSVGDTGHCACDSHYIKDLRVE